VEFPTQTELYLNEDAAQKIGIKLKDKLKNTAAKIVTKSKS
jgi:ABC-type uncharacterized transport system substrate-binding protein